MRHQLQAGCCLDRQASCRQLCCHDMEQLCTAAHTNRC
jgi:hypothetical protein